MIGIREEIEIIEKIFESGVRKCEEGLLEMRAANVGLELILNRETGVDFSKLTEALNYVIHAFKIKLNQVKNLYKEG
jgi:hypothetical protein